jgi:hypothetical protein
MVVVVSECILKRLDFQRISMEEFGIKGIEFVNSLFEVPSFSYLQHLIKKDDDLVV